MLRVEENGTGLIYNFGVHFYSVICTAVTMCLELADILVFSFNFTARICQREINIGPAVVTVVTSNSSALLIILVSP